MFYKKALEYSPNNDQALLGVVCAENSVVTTAELANLDTNFQNSQCFEFAMEKGSDYVKTQLEEAFNCYEARRKERDRIAKEREQKINKLNTDSGFVPDYNDPSNLWEPTRSPLYNLVCRIPSGYATGGYTTGTSGGWYAIALGLRQRIDANALEYCDICFEAAEYIKDNDSKNHGNNGLFGSDFAAGEPINTCEANAPF